MGDICRTCSQGADPATAENLFEPSSASLLVQIENLTSMQLEDDDNLPRLICQNCQLDLKIATEFRRVCIEAQQQLQLQVLNSDKDEEALEYPEYQVIDGSLQEYTEDVIDFLPETQNDVAEISEGATDPEYLKPSLGLDVYTTAESPADVPDMFLTYPQLSDETYTMTDVLPEPEGCQENEVVGSPETTDYTCSNCGLAFDNAEELQTHKYQLHDVSPNTKFVCDHCEEGFRSADALSRHCKLIKHPCIHECVKCTVKFHSQILLDAHSVGCQKPLEGKHVCHICGKRLSSASILKTHLLRHTGTRPHKCEECDASFPVAAELKTHMKTHSSVRSYACRYNCGKAFRFCSARSSHERTHMDDSKRIYQCEYCPKSFVTPSDCRGHQKQHNMARNHSCDTCRISFRHNNHYQNHLKSNAHKVLEARAAAAKRHPYFPH